MTTRDKLTELSGNLWWSWNPDALALFRRLNAEAFYRTTNNPLAALRQADEDILEDAAFARDVDEVYERFRAYMTAEPRFSDAPLTTYLCMEYGLHESMALYAGGLGILAGDHAKAASDLGLPFTTIGLYLKEGYFTQHFSSEGRQQETYHPIEPERHPLTLVRDLAGNEVTVAVHIGDQEVRIRAWRINLGRNHMYLLDSDVAGNPEEFRTLTHKLYQGGNRGRIQQEIVLGIGGLRMVRKLGIETEVFHMNEGHCAFLALEMLRENLAGGADRETAEARVRELCVFTTHTPVLAGHDRFDPDLFTSSMSTFREEIGMSESELLAYGRVNPADFQEWFTMTVLGLRLSRQANGVSSLNGQVARGQWNQLYPDRPRDEVPIDSITNGIHLPTWTAPQARPFLNRHLGDWEHEARKPEVWERLDAVSDDELWAYRSMLRRRLVDFANTYTHKQTMPQTSRLDPDALTIGFARRFATYKRAPLLFYDEERALELFTKIDRPIQVIYAGKAHPADEGGKRFIQQIFEMSDHPDLKGRLIFLENYNMEVGKMLVSGCDVWLNNPRRPMEASGTSGQKVAIHGGLNLSILDGWWPEGYNGKNGWAIGHDASADEALDPDAQDAEDARFLYETFENSVIPKFYERDDRGLPTEWLAFMREAMRSLPYDFSAERMVVDYVEQMYRAPVSARS
jgi:glycogen phosphorylase